MHIYRDFCYGKFTDVVGDMNQCLRCVRFVQLSFFLGECGRERGERSSGIFSKKCFLRGSRVYVCGLRDIGVVNYGVEYIMPFVIGFISLSQGIGWLVF